MVLKETQTFRVYSPSSVWRKPLKYAQFICMLYVQASLLKPLLRVQLYTLYFVTRINFQTSLTVIFEQGTDSDSGKIHEI